MNLAQLLLMLLQVLDNGYRALCHMGLFLQVPNDKWWFKVLVFLCISMCIADTVATGMWTYDWAVTNYANPAALGFTHWALAVDPLLLATCGLSVQLFYACRVWIMSIRKNRILPVVIVCLSTLGWCMVCWIVYTSATHKLILDLSLVLPAAWVWLVGSVGADILITSSMIYYLDLRFRIEFQQAQVIYRAPRRFRRLIARTVECNLLSLFAQAIAFGLFNHSGIRLYYRTSSPSSSSILLKFILSCYIVGPEMMLAKVYTFSLLVSLNSRHHDNGTGTSYVGFSPSRGGNIELGPHVLDDRHTCTFSSTQIPVHTQRETNEGQKKGLAFNADESF
ncbi:hypothetical protein BT96DRAFT_258509 [Gymnopus androsaceus JB14]|uniref:DUF6534 domain-containing protein n=1 Tax=Gymnopus androsaceus JB14 TaxID=1447944 RepID=A0A6A4H413_9AGAR|nr:hypothetical protein BT96DRAFT_258509 [Gymnopus androsaceus JB14]